MHYPVFNCEKNYLALIVSALPLAIMTTTSNYIELIYFNLPIFLWFRSDSKHLPKSHLSHFEQLRVDPVLASVKIS